MELPHSLEAEAGILSIMMNRSIDADIALAKLKGQDFYSTKHRSIFKAVKEARDNGKEPDIVVIGDILKRRKELDNIGGLVALSDLANGYVTGTMLDSYIRTVRQKSTYRQMAAAAEKLKNMALHEDENTMSAASAMLGSIADDRDYEPQEVKQLIPALMDDLDRRVKAKGGVTGVPTGFRDLDMMTSGLHPADYIIVAGRPGMGKTAFSTNIAVNVAKKGITTLLFSLEMSAQQLAFRMLANESGVDSQKMRIGRIVDGEWPKIALALGRMEKLSMLIDDKSSTLAEIRASARRAVMGRNVGLIVIDYIGLIMDSLPGRSREQEVAMISKGIKAMAKDLNVPIIALSQLSRAATRRDEGIPSLADLRDSGALEQDADVVIFVHREDYYRPDTDRKGIADIIIAKQRNGPLGKVEMQWDAKTTSFHDLAFRI